MRYDFDLRWTIRRKILRVPPPSDQIQVSFVLIEQLLGFMTNEFPYIDPGEKLIAIMNPTRSELRSSPDLISENLSKIGLAEESHDPIIEEIKASVDYEPNLSEICVDVRFLLFKLDENEENLDRFKANPAARSSIEAMEKVEVSTEIDSSCIICLEKFSLDMKVSRMPCSHIYHRDCIARWLNTSYSCPSCRFKICDRV